MDSIEYASFIGKVYNMLKNKHVEFVKKFSNLIKAFCEYCTTKLSCYHITSSEEVSFMHLKARPKQHEMFFIFHANTSWIDRLCDISKITLKLITNANSQLEVLTGDLPQLY